jgi:hypothetical protein
MTALTATQIKAILENLSYPYLIRFYTYIPSFKIYPYITIRKQPPVSTTEDYTDVGQKDGFEITLNIRYTVSEETEEQNQTTIETTILNAMENTDFGTSAVYFESKQWNRVAIPRLYGSQSTLKILVTDQSSVSGEGVLGSQMEIQTSLGNIELFSMTTTEGADLASSMPDTGTKFDDFAGLLLGNITFEYESNSGNNTIVKALTNGDIQNITIVKGGQSFQVDVLFGITTKRGQYDKVERATTGFGIQAFIDSQRVNQFSVDAILI